MTFDQFGFSVTVTEKHAVPFLGTDCTFRRWTLCCAYRFPVPKLRFQPITARSVTSTRGLSLFGLRADRVALL